ncbi:MAG TPA: Crp/Fnr family transcriptional regulator [bacterium]|jgi:CRP-like cAMP-binding protein|nr:Crp/Fnr family transcriptional regulator [bacterium]
MAADPAALLRRVSLFVRLDDAALKSLAGRLRRRTYRRGTMIFHKDQAGDGLHIIESGRVRFFLPAERGEELTIDVAGEGEVFGELALLDGQPRSASVEALEDTVTHVLGREEFQASLAASPELAAAVIGLLSTRLRHVTDYAESLAFLDVHARVARALLELAGRYGVRGDGITIDLDLTQTNLATMVGATRERVNRALAAFREQGIVDLRGRQIVLRDPDRLRLRVY